jgi:hypothetical protein
MRVIEKVVAGQWAEIAESCPYATFFHTPYWAEFMEQTFPVEDVTKAFVFDNGVRVVFPLMRRRHPKWRIRFLDEYISGLLFVYGGPVSDGECTAQQMLEIWEYMTDAAKHSRSILVRGSPFYQMADAQGYKEVPDFSHVVELYKYETEKELLRSYSRGIRSHINTAKKRPLNIRKAQTDEECEQFYRIYAGAKKHWDEEVLTDYPEKMFHNFFTLNIPGLSLWTVHHHEQMIGGCLVLVWNNYCESMMMFFDREFSHMHANRHLLHHIFLQCKEDGIKYFDFRQSGGVKGVEFFKRTMGGREYHYTSLLKEKVFIKKAASIRRRFC